MRTSEWIQVQLSHTTAGKQKLQDRALPKEKQWCLPTEFYYSCGEFKEKLALQTESTQQTRNKIRVY